MILTKSPHYIDIPWSFNSSIPNRYVLQLFVLNGEKVQEFEEPTFEYENKNPLQRSGNSKVDISNLVDIFITTDLVKGTETSVLDSNSASWILSNVIYFNIDGSSSGITQEITNLAIKGFGYGIEGENTTIPSNNILAYAGGVKVSRESNFTLPIKVSETESKTVTVISYPNNEINKTFTIDATTNSNEIIKNVYVKCSETSLDDYIHITYDNTTVELTVIDELRYIPIDIWFVNRYGQLYSLTFFKDRIESLIIESDEYQTFKGQPINGMHEYERYNITGRTSFKAKSGFVSEQMNEVFKQLYLSDRVWVFDGEVFNPVNVKGRNIQYKTRQRERLVDYEVEFEYAYNEINRI